MARVIAGEFHSIVKTVMTVDEEKANKVSEEYSEKSFDEYDVETREKILKDAETQFYTVITTDDGSRVGTDITDYMIKVVAGKRFEITPDYISKVTNELQKQN